jgi:hypothetical protein
MMKVEWKGIGVVVVLVSLLAAAVIPLVMAAEGPGVIHCTVTTGVYSVTLDRTSVAYGQMEEYDEKEDPLGTNYANNSGTLPEDLMIRGEDAEGPEQTPQPTWTLGTEPGVDIYTHTFNAGTETSLTTDDQTLAEDVIAGQKVGFTLKLYTPTSIGTNGDYSFSVYVVAMAPEA